jgi:hypothetical protein
VGAWGLDANGMHITELSQSVVRNVLYAHPMAKRWCIAIPHGILVFSL